ncbi:hypothetical protein [Citrobacter sp. RHBSTW-00671]|nr:hypothetical protein [Citrobacter sp. RHBSTW-00671]MBA7969655.1 hypothetical protein [Citrobacter sp. RHBSTW-00671]
MQNNKQIVIAALQTLITDPLHDEGKIAVFLALLQIVGGDKLIIPFC